MRSILIVVSLLLSTSLVAQNEETFSDRLVYGGDFVLNFSNRTVVAGASPQVGYKILDRWTAGIGGSFLYYKYNDGFWNFSTMIYGPFGWTRVQIVDQFFVQTEFHSINTDVSVYDPATDSVTEGRGWIPLWYVGGGYRQAIGNNVYMSISAMWDLIQDLNSPYANPMIRGGITVGF